MMGWDVKIAINSTFEFKKGGHNINSIAIHVDNNTHKKKSYNSYLP